MTIIFAFPGQSSRYPEMIEKLAERPPCAKLIAEASDLLDRDLRRHYRSDNPAVFATNRDVQVGVFLANQLHLALLADAGVKAQWSLGLSLGEYNHLVHIGAVSFADALPLVDARGRLYDEAQGGLMVSVFPLEPEPIEQAIARLGVTERVAIGLYNSPRQQVLSGPREDVERVLAELEAVEYFDATVIEPRIPMHAPCFVATGERLAAILADVQFSAPRGTYVPNIAGAPVENATAEQIRSHLAAHVHRPVRWRASVDAIAERVPAPWFIEVGPRAVIHNLFGKHWMPGRRGKTDFADDDWRARFDAIAKELRDAQ